MTGDSETRAWASDSGTGEPDRTTTRRRFVCGGVAAALAAVAGCFEVPPDESRTFRADPVVLPGPSREALAVEEALREELTDEREETVGEERYLVRLHDEGAAYRRVRAEPTLLEDYVDAATNRGADGAVVVPASRLGLAAESTAAGLWDGWDVPVERVGFLVPAGARADGEVGLDEVLALAPGDAAGVEEASVGVDAVVGLFVEPSAFLPAELYVPGEFYVPEEFYLPDGFASPDGYDRGGVLYVDDSARAVDLFGRTTLPGRTVDDDEPVDLANVLLAAPGDAVFDGAETFDPEAVFDLGEPAPLAGREFGVAALSTPDATIEDVAVNPLADATLEEAPAHEHVGRLLRAVGITDADPVEWLRGPVALEPGWFEAPEASLLAESEPVSSLGGVVAGVDGPHAVLLHAASAADDDRVFAFGVSSRPVGSPDGRDALVGEDGFVGRERFSRAGEVAGDAISRVDRPDG